MEEVLAAIVRRSGAQTTYNALARDLSIDHPATVRDYIAVLTSMDVLRVQPALREDKLAGAPKKARKIGFCDPFIFHAVQSGLHPDQDPFTRQVRPLLADPERTGTLVEACAVAHYGRRYPTYYIKGEGEVDIAYIKHGRFWSVEIKWTGQLRPKTLKQMGKYANSRILARRSAPARIGEVPVEFLPRTLLCLELEGADSERGSLSDDKVHKYATYDVEVDTSTNAPEDGAAQVLQALQSPRNQRAFQELIEYELSYRIP